MERPPAPASDSHHPTQLTCLLPANLPRASHSPPLPAAAASGGLGTAHDSQPPASAPEPDPALPGETDVDTLGPQAPAVLDAGSAPTSIVSCSMLHAPVVVDTGSALTAASTGHSPQASAPLDTGFSLTSTESCLSPQASVVLDAGPALTLTTSCSHASPGCTPGSGSRPDPIAHPGRLSAQQLDPHRRPRARGRQASASRALRRSGSLLAHADHQQPSAAPSPSPLTLSPPPTPLSTPRRLMASNPSLTTLSNSPPPPDRPNRAEHGVSPPPSTPHPAPSCPQASQPAHQRVMSHQWDDSPPARPTPPSTREEDIPHLRLLQRGIPIPQGSRPPPADAARAWDAAGTAPLDLGVAPPDLGVAPPGLGAAPPATQPQPSPPLPQTSCEARPVPTAQSLKVLLLFAGSGEADSNLPALLRQAGCTVTAIDTKIGGASHDVLRSSVGRPLLDRVRGGQFDAVFIATPCSSYSVHHQPALRSDTEPLGKLPVPPEWRAYLLKHNLLGDYTAQVWLACVASDTPVALENPADRSDPTSQARWDQFPHHGSLWRVPRIASTLGDSHASFHTFAQCAFASRAQKWTTIASWGDLSRTMAGLGTSRYHCAHTHQRHPEVLTGRDEQGRSRAGEAAAYPPQLNAFLARAITESALATRRRRSRRAVQVTQLQLPTIVEGFVSEGFALGPTAHSACEAARSVPTRFSHADHSIPAPLDSLRDEPFPGDLSAPVVSSKPTSTCKAMRRRRLPHPLAVCQWVGCCSDPTPKPAPASEPIAIQALFLEGVYEAQVVSWLALADTAAAAIRSGAHPPHVPTRVIGQDQLQPWARGTIWDCITHGHLDCRPVQRSTRHTAFPGKRQVDRPAVRRVADLLGWHDQDIVDQVGEGGIEVRSDCTLDIVLTFHHASLLRDIGLAEKSVADHIGEGWTAPPTRHLPYVPCRLQPRGVIMQPRSRLMPDGVTLEEYEKPRITTDSSFGGPDSVNAAVGDTDRSVRLPSIQTLGRGWAICQTAYPAHPAPPGLSSHADVQGYCIDAESAYSFCPIQVADLWTQCFCWWDSEGAAGVAFDRRMGFGGAFAPNRFERFSTLVAAYAQHLQADFDATQPPPPSVQNWTASRRVLQRLGQLPPGDAQLHPKFLQVFQDDFTGAAGSDIVTPPASVAHVTIQPQHMLAAGCTPAPSNARVHVHARLTIVALHALGLHAAPHKVAIGAPLPALGMLVDGHERTLRCPPTKRRTMLVDLTAQLVSAQLDGTVDRSRARRLVGRLSNLSQVEPLIRPHLHAGYTVVEARWAGAGGQPGTGTMHMRMGGRAHSEWISLLSHSHRILSANHGVALAPRTTVPPRDAPFTLTSATDASGEDGIGGYAFHSSAPLTAYVFAEEWPAFALRALQAASSQAEASLRDQSSPHAQPHLSMPAAELFAQALLPIMVSRLIRCDTVYAVGDCGPAVGVIDSLHSRNPQMRAVLHMPASLHCSWVGVKVPREANRDPDRLSHPHLLDTVCEDASDAGLQTVRVRPLSSDWEALRHVIAVTAPSPDSRPPRKRRR